MKSNIFKHSVGLATIIIISVFVIVAIVIALCVFLPGYGEIYETTYLWDYGKIIGNFDNDTPKAFITSFFPEEIDDSFSEIVYHYKAKKGDGYAYECYLEFVIEDPDEYQAFVEEHINVDESVVFAYDEHFYEQSVSNVLLLQTPRENEAVYPISNAELGKILFSNEEQRLIFVAIGMYDGGGTNTVELSHFFSRFQIDPLEYEKTAYATNYYQEKNIPNYAR